MTITDRIISGFFFLLTTIFIVFVFIDEKFFDWVFWRHQNILSWYIRPIFIIPFCFFSYKRSLVGVSITLFLLFTSMFWFTPSNDISEEVKEFLEFEKRYLQESWGIKEWIFTLSVPLSLWFLARAFWKRSFLLGAGVMIVIALAKIGWSVNYAGDAGRSILIPALVGLFLCLTIFYLFRKRLIKNN